jgi:hypothetical protein
MDTQFRPRSPRAHGFVFVTAVALALGGLFAAGLTAQQGESSTLAAGAARADDGGRYVLMYDGRFGSLEAQARAAIADHAQGTEKRGRLFFEDVPLGLGNSKQGTSAVCHSGPMLNDTKEFFAAPPFKRGGRFQSVLVSELNKEGNPVIDFVFRNLDGTTMTVSSPDPGRALITGSLNSPDSLNAFKIPTLWGVANTAPYFHDNSAKTLDDVVRHYATFFQITSNPAVDGDPAIDLTDQDQALSPI